MGTWTLLFECLIAIFFSFTVIGLLLKKDHRTLSELVAGVIFGFLLEFMNVFLTKSYTYNPQFIIQLGQVPNNIPISIALAWGLIMMNSHYIIQRYNLPTIAEICAETLFGLTFDIIMDIIAIRLDGGFWNWFTVPFTSKITWQGVCGVPWGNYYGWFCVLLIASTIFHIERKKIKTERKGLLILLMVLNPFIAWICLFGLLFLIGLFILSGFSEVFPPGIMLLFGLIISIAFLIVIIYRIRIRPKITYSQSLQSILFIVLYQLFFFIAALVEGIFMEMWGLVIAEVLLVALAIFIDVYSLKGPKFTFL